MREVTTIQKIYTFEELSEKSQKRAMSDWIESETEYYDLADDITCELKEFYLDDYGLKDFELQYSLSHSQGDGVAFYGKLEDLTKLISKMDLDTTLDTEYLSLEIEHTNTFRYNHYDTMLVTVNSLDELTVKSEKELLRLEETIADKIRLLSKELESAGYRMIDYHLSEENAKESILANEYEYLEDGKQY